MNSLALVLLLVSVHLVFCRSGGAPSSSCRTMVPGHFDLITKMITAGQRGKSPFVLNATWDNNLRVVRLSVSGEAVAGFLIQGRFKEEGPAVGRFVNITAGVKYQDCTLFKFAPESSVTHTNAQRKENLLFYWEPPREMNKTENITFYATLVETMTIFWVKQESDSLNLNVMEEDDKGLTTTVIPSFSTNAQPEVDTTEPEVDTDGNVKSTETTTGTGPTDRGSNTSSLCLSLISILLISSIYVSLS